MNTYWEALSGFIDDIPEEPGHISGSNVMGNTNDSTMITEGGWLLETGEVLEAGMFVAMNSDGRVVVADSANKRNESQIDILGPGGILLGTIDSY
jgi:hypothetical protein